MTRQLLLVVAVFGATSHLAFADPSLVQQGEQLYRSAISLDGESLRAVVQSDVSLPAGASACANCHRRSGIGIAEGGKRSLNISAPALFAPSTKPPLRPAYDDQTLLRAIMAGIDSAGRPLDATMPRYELRSDNAASLLAYLKSLGATPPDGVSPTELRIATILAPDAPAEERDAVEKVLGRYVTLKNSETRLEARRAAAADRNYYGRSRQRAYRDWTLHTWTLNGATTGWVQQLNEQYDATRPFAIVSGAVGSGWPIVHEFCEQKAIPCIFPLTENVPETDGSFYPLYFSAGARLQASVTAEHIREEPAPVSSVLVVYEHGPIGDSAFEMLNRLLANDGSFDVSARTVAAGRSPSQRDWQQWLSSSDADVLVFWLPASVLTALDAGMRDDSYLPARIYTADFATNWVSVPVSSQALVAKLRHVYPYVLARPGRTQFPREHLWLKQHELDSVNEVAAAKVLYAVRMLGMVLADIQSNFSREYLLETFEHALDGTQLTSLFPRTSLGPGQRLLTRGANVVRVRPDERAPYYDAVWIQP